MMKGQHFWDRELHFGLANLPCIKIARGHGAPSCLAQVIEDIAQDLLGQQKDTSQLM